jgi:ubiquitin carboxyl-terminal hydrolase 7
LIFFEEIKPNTVERIEDLELPLEDAVEEVMDGNIFVFQKKLSGNEGYRLPTCSSYFQNLFFQVENLNFYNNLFLSYILDTV